MQTTIFYHGPIITMEKPVMVEAVFIRDGKIEKIGTEKEIFALKEQATEVVDLEGKTLMPSFIDAHSHFTGYAMSLASVSLSGAATFREIKERLIAFIAAKPLKPGEWIIGFGYDHNDLEEKRHPHKYLLDEVSKEYPVLISHASGHMGIANTKALEQLGIWDLSEDPPGGRIGRMEDGKEPDGYLEENAFIQSTKKVPSPTEAQLMAYLKQAEQVYVSQGITMAQDGLVRDREIKLLHQAAQGNQLLIDVVGYVDLKNNQRIIRDFPQYVQAYTGHFKIGGYKIFLDGSPQARTAWMSEPYENGDGVYAGYPIYKDKEVKTFAKEAAKEKMQLLCHCNGDNACEQFIKAIEQEGGERPVMIHAQTVRGDQLDRMKKLQMIPSFFAAHVYYWGDTHLKNLGKKRAEKISPLQEALKRNLVFTMHQDSPVIEPNMLETVWCAVNRRTKKGVILGAEERIPVLEALKAVTLYPAIQYFEEETKGSFKEGKAADCIILSDNPLTCPPEDIINIHVLETRKNNRILFQR